MNVEAGFGAVFSETGGGGGGFDRLSSVRSIAAFLRAIASTLAWRAASAALLASFLTASSEALQASYNLRDSFDASISPRASKHLEQRSWAFAYAPSASAELMALLRAWAYNISRCLPSDSSASFMKHRAAFACTAARGLGSSAYRGILSPTASLATLQARS